MSNTQKLIKETNEELDDIAYVLPGLIAAQGVIAKRIAELQSRRTSLQDTKISLLSDILKQKES